MTAAVSAGAPILEVRELTKRYGGLTAVDGVSFDVAPGSITAIIGPNGAGKSTCFNLISGFAQPTSGRLVYEGRDITTLSDFRVARLGIARTFQTTALFRNLTVLDNAIVGASMRAKSNVLDAIVRTGRRAREERECTERAREALRFAEIEHLADRYAASISQEEQRRLAIAVAIVCGPKLLLLDEPVAGVSHEEMGKHAALIRRIADGGCTVCLVEHKMHLVMGLADRIVVLHHGKKIAEGTPAQIQADAAVIDAYLGTKNVA